MYPGAIKPKNGDHMPDPSVLRIHPQTEARIARLMARKVAPADGNGLPFSVPRFDVRSAFG
jgi:hypothetical protein